ncbi:SNARE-like superfamily isoform 1 [Olea europaea subsp. europaea]|uniref:SNARE-like superfamily isoform 1 n=1 Tax=Olea europaea subsp. europaea TaxID=158383 RepID=A0A8S0QSP3_OLEEU|nr:SNARE-like superfamily isoform 1 [Olea europaea subsp. europaea]
MLLAVLIANCEGNILVERFNGVPAEERLHWQSFLVKLGADNLKGVKNEELLVASHRVCWRTPIKRESRDLCC